MRDNEQYQEAKLFLDLLSQGNPNETFHFRTFDDLKSSKRLNLIRVLVGTLDEHFDQLVELNNKGAGIFVCVNRAEESSKGDDKSITKVRAVFADKDDGNFDTFPIEPSILIQTKNGQHAYWITNEVQPSDFKEIQKAIIEKLKTDVSIHNLSRVMRLPGFYHKKDPNNPFLVKMLMDEGFEYTIGQILNAFPKSSPASLNVKDLKGSHAEILRHIERAEGAVEGQGGDLKTFQMACDLVRGFNLSEAEALSYLTKYNEKCKPTWSQNDLKIKLKSAMQSGTGEFGYLLKNLTTEQWVYKFIERNEVSICYNQKVKFKGEIIPASSLVRKAEIQWDNEGKKSKINVIKSVLEEWEIESRKQIINRVCERFKFESKYLKIGEEDLVSKFTRALVGPSCDKFVLHRAVIAHFLWQVKRKLCGRDVGYHICPVLVGRQGSGKTQAIDRLIRPLKDFSMEGNLGTFVRENERFVFGTYYIVKLDEFAKGSRSDIDTMKNIITSADVNYRTYYTQKLATMPNVSTFIGSSNRSVAEIFPDQTGNRRFYEIPCLDRIDWNVIGGPCEDSGMDYFALWKSINENDESPIIPYINEIQSYQEDFRAKSIIEEWLDSEDLIPHLPEDRTLARALKSLHTDFIFWIKAQNSNYSCTDQRLGRELKKFLEHKKRNDGSYYIVKVKETKSVQPIISQVELASLHKKDEVDQMCEEAMASTIQFNRGQKSN